MCQIYLLGDVPHKAGLVESYQPVVDGHFVKRGPLLVPKKRVRNPDPVPLILPEANVDNFGMSSLENQPLVAPRLPQVHTDGVVLQSHRSLLL